MAVTLTSKRSFSKRSEKRASTRLLDMLAGWADFVSRDEANRTFDKSLSAEDVGALYQLAGAKSMDWEEMTAEEEAEAVRLFVMNEITPLLTRGSSG